MLDLINVSYDTQIPNNVGLSSDKKVLKALEMTAESPPWTSGPSRLL